MARIEETLRTDASITMLVNNAGVGASAPLLASDIGKMDEMIALNVNALTRLTYAVAPGFVGAQGRHDHQYLLDRGGLAGNCSTASMAAARLIVLAFSQSLHHELADKGVVVQAVLPGATATEFWEPPSTPLEYLPKEIVMTAEDMVDAALAGLDQGELVTIPSLPDAAHWDAYEAARQTMRPQLSLSQPAARYRA